MARHFFGLGPADFAMQAIGAELMLIPNAVGTAWDSLTGGSPITDLQDQSFASVTTIVADGNGRIGFYGPDTICSLFVDFGFSRFLLVATDLGPAIDANTAGVAANAAGIAANTAGKLNLSGGTMTGPLALFGTTTASAVQGGTGSAGTLTLTSTSNATKGKILFGASSAFDEANTRLGIGTASPGVAVDVVGQITASTIMQAPVQQGGVGSGGNITIASTTHATKGKILIGTSAYDETNNRLGIGKNNPSVPLDVVGAAAISGNATVGGDLLLVGGTTTYRNQLAAVTPVSNTVTETVVASMTIPANDAVVGATYRITAWGSFNTAAATPTGRLRYYLGGIAGTLLADTGAITMGVASKLHMPWKITCEVTCQSTGAGGTWFPHLCFPNSFASAATAGPASGITLVEDGGNTATVSTTVSQVLAISFAWGTANGSNILSCQGFIAERVA